MRIFFKKNEIPRLQLGMTSHNIPICPSHSERSEESHYKVWSVEFEVWSVKKDPRLKSKV